MDTDEISFAKASIKKSELFTNDPLIEFVILWIGLNALYDNEGDKEKDKFDRYIMVNQSIIRNLLTKHEKSLLTIADFVNKTPQHLRLNEFLKTRKSFLKPKSSDAVLHFGQIIYKIRNNMFHAEKMWTQKDEEDLLKLVNPVMKDMLIILTQK